jgi:hypothetical protein
VYSVPISDLEVLQQGATNALKEIGIEPEFSTECATLCDKELQVVLKCTGTTQSICCRDHANIAISQQVLVSVMAVIFCTFK